jgi:hypothetical protein
MKKLITSLLVGLIGLNPGLADAAEAVDQELKDHSTLLTVVDALGIPITFDGQLCKKQPTWYGGYNVYGKDFAICNKGDRVDKLDTIRHEAWHVYQDLKDCDIKDGGLVVAFQSASTPRLYKEFAAKHYKPEHVSVEAEAFWAADTFDALTIATLLVQKGEECGYKFKF